MSHESYLLASDIPILEDLNAGSIPTAWQPVQSTSGSEVVFLSPLDYVSARGRAKDLFTFDYTWEIYKPAEIRKYGPYTLPILYGNRLVGRIDMKLERKNRLLVINGLWLEDGFLPDQEFVPAFSRGLSRFMKFVNADQCDTSLVHPKYLRQEMVRSLV